MPWKSPVWATPWLASNVIAPATVAMLEPALMAMFRAASKSSAPVPLRPMAALLPTLIVSPITVRSLSDVSEIPPFRFTVSVSPWPSIVTFAG